MHPTQRSSIRDVLNIQRELLKMELSSHHSVLQHLHVLDLGVKGTELLDRAFQLNFFEDFDDQVDT